MKDNFEDFIQLYSGRAFHFGNPRVEEVHIEDIAHALSLLCRFGGHCKEFYSVADHSIRCAENVSQEFKLEALLHDAGEAYIVDMPRPIKYALTEYRTIENAVDRVVRQRFNLPEEMSPEVKRIDAVMLSTERRDLMKPSELEWHKMLDPIEQITYPRSPKESYYDFMKMFNELTA